MARLPVPQQTVAPQNAYAGRRASASDLAPSLSGLAQGVGNLAVGLENRRQKQEQFDAQRDLATAGSDWMTELNDRQQQAPLGAPGFTDGVLKDFDAYSSKMVDERRKQGWSEDALNTLSNRMLGLRQDVQGKALSFENQSRGAKFETDAKNSLTNFSQMASGDPYQAGKTEVDWSAMVDSMPDIDAIQRENIRQFGLKNIRQAAALGLVQQDPHSVIDALTGGQGNSRSNYYASIRAAESGGNDSAVNQSSTATGRYQFTDGTWKGLMERHPGVGLTLDGRTNGDQQEVAIRLLTEENANTLSRAGIPVTNGNLYAAHFLGAGGASTVLKAPNGAAVAGLVSPEVVKANPFLAHMTVGQFRTWAADKGGGSAVTTPTNGKTGNPVLDALDAADRQTVLSRAYTLANQQDAQARATLDIKVQNASAALLETGDYAGDMPTQQDFVNAYSTDPVQGGIEWAAFQSTRAVGENIAAFKTLPEAEILSRLDALKPSDTASPTYANDLKAFDAAQKAASSILQQRAADPAGYVQKTFPNVQQAVETFKAAPAGPQQQQTMQAMIGQMNAAYDTMGTPQDKRSLLPSEQAKDVLARFGDTNQTFDDRTNSVLGLVFSTPDKAQQQQIFEQLVRQDNSFAKFQSAFEAYGRGDVGAARRLFQAGMTDPEKLPGKTRYTPADIQGEIANQIMADGQVGDATYGFSANMVGGETRALRDGTLMLDAVRYELSRNGDDLGKAVEQVKADIYGPVDVVDRSQIVVNVPKGTDQNVLERGLVSFLPQVRQNALTLKPGAPTAGPQGDQPGLLEQGNIDLEKRPVVKMADGDIATVRSISFEEDGKEVLIPTVSPDGRLLSDDEAIDLYRQSGQFLGKFDTAASADAYAEKLHDAQAAFYRPDLRGVFNVNDKLNTISIDDAIDHGEWRNFGDGFAFIETTTGLAMPDINGQPLVLSLDDVLAAGAQAQQDAPDMRMEIWQRGLGFFGG